jgi:hypothetical protein
MVRQPNYWIKTMQIEDVETRREIGYKKIRDLAVEGRLIIKDVSHGSTISFMETLVSYYQDKYPDKHIVLILDN